MHAEVLLAALVAEVVLPALGEQQGTPRSLVMYMAMMVRMKLNICHSTARCTYYGPDEDPFPPQSGTPQSADAANRVYGSSPSEAVELTPRTRDATANLMNKFVDRLFSVSKDLMSHLAIDAAERDESWVHELDTHKVVFNTFYKIYTDKAAQAFIDIDAVSERTKASDNVVLWQRMTKTVATANLANLLSDVEDLDSDHSYVLNRLSIFQRIDDFFPGVFIPGGRQALHGQDWLMDSETIELAFTVRTHRFIETLRMLDHANPFRLFAQVFFDLDVESVTDEMLEQSIGGANYKPFVGFDIMGPDSQGFRDKITDFRTLLTQMEKTAVVDRLEGEYPFAAFLNSMKDWIRVSEAKVPGPPRPVAHSVYNGDSPYSPGAQLQAEANSSRSVHPLLCACYNSSVGSSGLTLSIQVYRIWSEGSSTLRHSIGTARTGWRG